MVEHAKSLAIRIERLPAFATLNWCDQAAESLSVEFRAAVTVVIIGSVNRNGEITGIEAAGVHASGRDAVLADAIASIRSEIEAIGTLPVSSTPTNAISLRETLGEAWGTSRIGRMLRPLPVVDAFIAMRPISEVDAGRCVISIVGVMADSPVTKGNGHYDVKALLWSSTVHIADRAAIAIGVQRSTRGRWISEREREVLDLLVLGLSVRQIAEELGRSTHTVHDHVKSLHKKLNANSRGELVARALGHLGPGRVPAQTTLNAMPGSAIEPSRPMIDLSKDIAGDIEQKQSAGVKAGRAKQLPLD